jgi:hypothetical protein
MTETPLPAVLNNILATNISLSQLRHTAPLAPIVSTLLAHIFAPVAPPPNALEQLQFKQNDEGIDISLALLGEDRQMQLEQIEFLARNFEQCKTRAYVLRFLTPLGGGEGGTHHCSTL